ncbi:MAG: hypothetical protein ACYCWW_16690, partial [Deltaproteobacteria bacterium]
MRNWPALLSLAALSAAACSPSAASLTTGGAGTTGGTTGAFGLGGTTSGGTTSAGAASGGTTSGGSTSGGSTSGASTSGASTSGASTSGASTSGGSTGSGATAGATSGGSSGGASGSSGSSGGVAAACPFVGGVSLNAWNSPYLIGIDTTQTKPLPAGFVGANSEATADAMDWGNLGYQAETKQLGLGFVRYSAGTLSDAYDWTNGQFTWGSAFPGGAWTQTCLLDPRNSACTAGWGTSEMYAHWNVIDQNKTGQMSLASWIAFVKGAGVQADIDLNVFTDSPTSAGQLASALLAAGVTPALWELGNETYAYTGWSAPAGGYWASVGIAKPFASGESYAANVKPFADAIRAVFPGAPIALSATINSAWVAGLANWTTSTAPGGNCAAATSGTPCDQAHFPVYFDRLAVHPYACHFLPNDNALEAECMNQKLYVVGSTLPPQ